jgi:hypothetical protein
MKTAQRKNVLLLGNINHEGITSLLKSSGRPFMHKILHSGVANWNSILQLFDSYGVETVLAKITARTYHIFYNPAYSEVAKALFERISSVPHVIYIFEGLLLKKEEIRNPDEDLEPYWTDLPDEQIIDHVNNLISSYSLNILPYLTSAEVTISAQKFLDEVDEGLIFRVYMPSGHLWEHEIEKILILFREYLSKISGQNIRLNQTRTTHGVVYAFNGDGSFSSSNLNDEFNDFSNLLSTCFQDPLAAEVILKDKKISSTEIGEIITRYAKEAKRIYIDLKQTRESKILSIRHRLESELIDMVPDAIDIAVLSQIIDKTIPPLQDLKQIVSFPPRTHQITNSNLTINVNPQIIEKVEGLVANAIQGDVHYSPEDKNLMQLFNEFGGTQIQELTTALHELKDISCPKPERITAKQRIKKFLIACSSKTGDVAFGLLQKYIENQLFGKS